VSEAIQISRVNRTKDQARTAYNRMSKWYDILAGSSERRFIDAGLQSLAVAEGETALEIGFGTGHAILTLARSVGSAGQVYGIDISDGMLKVTQKRVEKAGLIERVDLRRGDATQLPFEADFFDAVFMSFTLELFDTPDIPRVLRECCRVLRVGGRLCVVAMAMEEHPGLMLRLYEWAHEKLPRYVDCRPIFVMQEIANAGFPVINAVRVPMWGLPVEIVLAEKERCAESSVQPI
jgi:ubiquinone/menaquinone biosynthesis C-methylase UbiE